MRPQIFFAVVAGTVLLTVSSHGASTAVEKDPFDLNGDGTLDPNEQRVRLMHRADAFYRKYDTNKDGVISPAENEVHRLAVMRTVSMDEQSLREERGKSGSILPAEME